MIAMNSPRAGNAAASALALTIALVIGGRLAQAEPQLYDLASRALAPLIATASEQRGPAAGGLDAALVLRPLDADGRTRGDVPGVSLRILFQAPGQLLVEGELDGRRAVICRDGERVWAAPRVVVAPFIERLPPAPEDGRSLPPMVLPISAGQAALLPALLELENRGSMNANGRQCQVVEARLLDQLAQSLAVSGWQALLWIEPESAAIERVKLAGPTWGGRLDVVRLDIVPAFPDTVWRPADGIDAVDIDPARLAQLLERLLAQ